MIKMSAYFSGWTGNNNLGDDLVQDAFIYLLGRSLKGTIFNSPTVSINVPGAVIYQKEFNDTGKKFDFGVLGGGSTIAPMYAKNLFQIKNNNKNIFVHGSGYQHTGEDIKDFSDIFSILSGLEFGGVRGPDTLSFLYENNVENNLNILCDPGLISPWVFSIDRSILSQFDGLDDFILINYMDVGEWKAYFLNVCIYIMSHLKKNIVLAPLYQPDIDKHHSLRREILMALPHSEKKVFSLSKVPSVSEFLGLMNSSIASISMKLHSWIPGLALGVPSIAFGGNLKYKDINNYLSAKKILFSDQLCPPSPEELLTLLFSDTIKAQSKLIRRQCLNAYHEHIYEISRFLLQLLPFNLIKESQEVEIFCKDYKDGNEMEIVFLS